MAKINDLFSCTDDIVRLPFTVVEKRQTVSDQCVCLLFIILKNYVSYNITHLNVLIDMCESKRDEKYKKSGMHLAINAF